MIVKASFTKYFTDLARRHPELFVATFFQPCFWLHVLGKSEKTSFCFVSSVVFLSLLRTLRAQGLFWYWILTRQTSFGANLALDLASFPLASGLCAKVQSANQIQDRSLYWTRT